jgi:hypothetical protein
MLVLVAALMLFPRALLAGGREVTVVTTSGESFSGELLSLRSRELVLTTAVDASDSVLAHSPGLILRLPYGDIAAVRAEGHSNLGKGIAIGMGAGIAAGLVAFAVTANDESDGPHTLTGFGEKIESTMSGAVMFGTFTAGGLLLGTVFGAASSQSDIDMDENIALNIGQLRSDVRYPYREPDFLVNMQ